MLADNTNKYFSQLSWSGWKLLPHMLIEDCRGWWLRGCCSSVADHWWLMPRFDYWQLPAFSLSSIVASRLLNPAVNYCCILTVLTVMQGLLSWLMHRWGRVPDTNSSLEISLCRCLMMTGTLSWSVGQVIFPNPSWYQITFITFFSNVVYTLWKY